MPIRVAHPNGETVEFPDGTDDETISRVMRQLDAETDARNRAGGGGVGANIGASVGRSPAATRRASPEDQRAMRARAFSRNFERHATPFGLGFLTVPLRNMIADPDRRQNVVDSAQRFGRDVQNLPNVNWGQVANETGQNIQQGFNDLPQTAGSIASHLPEIARAITYGPFEDEERAQRSLELARALGDDSQVREQAAEANRQGANAGLNFAAPLAFGAVRTVPQAAVTAAALDAPFALSRNAETESLQERLPDAATEIGGSAAFGAGAQALTNAAPAVSRMFPSRGRNMVARMDRAGASVDASGAPQQPRGVTPSLATANGGTGVSGPATKMVGDNILGGVFTRGRVRRALTETRDATRDVRDAYGRAQGRDAAGRRLQGAIERTVGERGLPNPRPGTDPLRVPVREWSAASKATAVFDQALRPIESSPAQLTNTQSALAQLLQRADSPLVRAFNADKVMAHFRSTVQGLVNKAQRGGVPPTLRDLRELRRGVREAQGRVRIGPDTVDNGALRQVEAALTQDIYAAAGQRAPQLQAADRYYARMMNRIDGLRRVVGNDPAQTFEQIMRAANPRTENLRFLAALRSALPDDEWRVFVASLIDDMGRPLEGASGFVAEQGFSVARFASAMRGMTPRARRIVFGSRGGQGGAQAATMRQLADDLDNLAEVALAQKGVEQSANFSGSGRDANNFATFGIGVTNVPAAMGIIGSMMITGEMLTNPAFVRWLVSAQRRGGGPAGIRRQLAALRDLATRDPALIPAVESLEAQIQEQQSPPAPGAAGDPARTPPQREPAYQ